MTVKINGINKVTSKLNLCWLSFQYQLLQSKLSFPFDEVLIVAGDPRGGSTWLAELIRQIPGTAILWEPLAINRDSQFSDLGFCWRQYIPEREEWPEARKQFETLFSGNVLSPYLCMRTSPEQLRKAKHLLVKFCRANQLLPWLTRQFSFKYAPIYLVRHPCSVIASQLKQGGWEYLDPSFEIPVAPYQSFYSEHENFISTINTVEKRLAFIWCLCNFVPLRHPENNKRWITILYEHLLMNGAKELQRIEKRWGLNFPSSTYDSIYIASKTTVAGSPIQIGKIDDQLKYWQTRLNSEQISDVLSVLEYFNITLYGSGILPTETIGD